MGNRFPTERAVVKQPLSLTKVCGERGLWHKYSNSVFHHHSAAMAAATADLAVRKWIVQLPLVMATDDMISHESRRLFP